MAEAGSAWVWIDGRFVAPREARVAATDRGLLLGHGVFATMRGYSGRCFRAREHVAQLAKGAAIFGIDLPASEASLVDLAHEAAAKTGASDAYVRITVTAGAADGSPVMFVIARPFSDVPSEDDYARGVAAVTVETRRPPPECMDPAVKSTSYGAQVLARREAAARGASEGVQLAVDGTLACGTMSTLFVVKGSALVTPPLSTGCRDGVTRRALLALARAVGLTPVEATIAPGALRDADEAFFASTRVECLPLATLDGERACPGRGFERTSALRAALRDLVREETARAA
jgi:branched-chain amino acid aminotransferase